jgi:hypothetical protein
VSWDCELPTGAGTVSDCTLNPKSTCPLAGAGTDEPPHAAAATAKRVHHWYNDLVMQAPCERA